MGKFLRTAFALMFLLLLPLTLKVTGFRTLLYNYNTISDGVDRIQKQSSFIRLYTTDSTDKCEQMYGFLPCSKSVTGHFFLIVVYEYLLFHGEYYVAMGGERIFRILGPNSIFGASAFHILGFLPEALILLASGLLNSKEVAQEYVLTGVGLLAGSTILLLTLIWGTCVFVGSQQSTTSMTSNSNPSAGPSHMQNHLERFLSQWTGAGLVTDVETCYTARIMVLSVIPFIIILAPTVLHLSATPEQIFIILCLVVSIVFLLSYFFYQMFRPWIQTRRLEYINHEQFVVDVLKHVQKHTIEKLLQEDGSPNISTIKKLFEEADQNGDEFISVPEFKQLFMKIRSRKLYQDKDFKTDEVMEEFDLNDDGMIDMDEFIKGFMRWIDETKDAMGKRYHSIRSLKDIYEILQPWLKMKREEHEMIKHILLDIFQHVESTAVGTLYTEDGKPNIPAIRKLFKSIDHNKDNAISRAELKQLITNIQFGAAPSDADEKVDRIIKQFDVSRDEMISMEEFVTGFSQCLNPSHLSSESKEDIFQKNWETAEKLLHKETDRSAIAWMQAILLLVIGIVILGLLAEPLIKSVGSFSRAINVPSFFISFILVPLATNARIAISAINEASRKKQRTNSLTLSEIYGGVFINNMLGLFVLLSLIYFRGLAWNFSAEVLSVLLVCGIMGCIASLSTSFPVWVSAIAFLLYPFSLVLVYVLHYDFFV
ncbi:sodium/calcium exchanger NCL2-like isoform X1 [Lycium barbarum]|uniref:sodium/calcium exchanger NCL2-like isoform X1 n=1 Tax=Lycium barbarum TaxID=112863 RepID=UPI00293F1BEB|nr:sodium/calcium exchanger NCL2-like isoform X1 [Lycium barbarum]